ncbi:MAG: DUF4281 domain-containing protein [Devosiaceae bacterium]|nr:DUF4281 domain-containing protein [Devosiaceae bacterium]
MDFELIFSVVGMMAMFGWLTLLFSPLIPRWSDQIAGHLIPVALALGYTVILVFFPAQNNGGFGSFADVKQLFTSSNALMAGWIHFLAFDLVVGAWICREARKHDIKFWMVVPCLPVTFMFGPAGFLLFSAVRGLKFVSVRAA